MTLDELKASAPRTFDKTLCDLLVEIQQGRAPIRVEGQNYDDGALKSRLAELEASNKAMADALADAAAAFAGLNAMHLALEAYVKGLHIVKVEEAA